jgi:hypothetical protein
VLDIGILGKRLFERMDLLDDLRLEEVVLLPLRAVSVI